MTMTPTTSLRTAPTHGPRLWYATLSGIVLWIVHLTALAALVNLMCDRPGVEWVMHGATVVLGLATLLALWWCVAIIREAGAGDDEAGDLAGRLRFMGWFGFLTEVTSLLLIAAEGIYVPLFHACA